MRLSKAYNRRRFASPKKIHQERFNNSFERLLDENGWSNHHNDSISMNDGYLIDTSRNLPYLEEVIKDADRIIEQRGNQEPAGITKSHKPFFFELIQPQDLIECPSFLNFIMSSEILAVVGQYMQTSPLLSRSRPPAVRLMKSTDEYDPNPDGIWRESQNYHLDHHDDPVVYVIVLVRDVTSRCGPFTILGKADSAEVARQLNYQSHGIPYRVLDEQIYSIIDPSRAIEFSYPKGSVLFLESSRCFHYGSRKAVEPRYQLMYAFTTPCRTDLSEFWAGPVMQTETEKSELRSMVTGLHF